MKTVSRVIPSVLLALSLSACADSRQATNGETPVETRTFLYADGADAKSRVERRILASGAEVLHGETEIQSDGADLLLVEDARLDARGQLTWAEIALSKRCSGEAPQRITYEATHGVVRTLDAKGERRWRAPADAPWMIAPPRDAQGRSIATPVSGWIAIRAAASAPALRVIDAGASTAYAVPSDQLAVATERGTTAVLGGAGIDAGPLFVEDLRLLSLGRSMKRVEALPTSSDLACGQAKVERVQSF
jgi:hypothetical protein